MIEYNALCKVSTQHKAQLLQPTDHRNTANTASKTVVATSSSVLKKFKRSERISTGYKPMFHASYIDQVFVRSTYSGCLHFQIFQKRSTIFKIFSK